MTPTAVEPCDPVVGLDRSSALGTLGVAIPFDPMVSHRLGRFFRLDIGADAGSRSPLNASFVNRILTNWQKKIEI